MRILVISDTHGSLKNWEKIKNIVDSVDEVFHLGDILYHGPRNPLPDGYDPKNLAEELKKTNVNYVRGNCDADVDLKVLNIQEMPKQIIEYFGNLPVYFFHGEVIEDDGFDLIAFAKKHDVKIVLHGHTHIPKIEEIEGVVVANPGSLSLPKRGFTKDYIMIYCI